MDDRIIHITADASSSSAADRRSAAQQRLIERLRGIRTAVEPAVPRFSVDADQFQRSVIESLSSTIRMIAPAGSGKTQTIVNRALHRVSLGTRPERIQVLTFDNSAVSSVEQKLAEGSNGTLGIGVATLNAFGYGILREQFPALHGRVSDDRDRRFRFRRLRRKLAEEQPELEGSLPAALKDSFYVQLFGLLKNSLMDPRDLDSDAFAECLMDSRPAASLFEDPEDDDLVDSVIDAIERLYVALDEDLRGDHMVDFDDQKLRAYVALRDRPVTASAIQARFDEVIVDEFQDINELDFALIELISRKATLVVTGDDDQSIYGFRGTTPDFMIDLESHLGRPIESRVLEINYRCPPNIVSHAVRLIEHNTRRLAKQQVPHQEMPADIAVTGSLSSGLESRLLLDYIRRLLDGGVEPADIAILYRTNAQSLPLQVELILADIPYQVRPEDNILTNEVLERLVGVLRARSALQRGAEPRPDDSIAIVRGYFRALKSSDIDELRTLFRRDGFQASLDWGGISDILPKASARFTESVRMLVATTSLPQAMTVLADRFRGMTGMVGSLEEAVEGGVPLAEVNEIAANFEDADAFVETMERAIRRATTTDAGADARGVQLLTYFRSKGRQWHTVILVSCNEGLIPHRRAELEEERRLFYVAMTRASKNLLVSYVDLAVSTRTTPSRFLFEAGLLARTPGTVADHLFTSMSPPAPDWRLGVFVSTTEPTMLSLSEDGRLLLDSGAEFSSELVRQWAPKRRWAVGADAADPQARYHLPALYTLQGVIDLLASRPMTGRKFSERGELVTRRFDLASLPTTNDRPVVSTASPAPMAAVSIEAGSLSASGSSDGRTEPSLEVPVARAGPRIRKPIAVVCADAVDAPGHGYRWTETESGRTCLDGNGVRLLMRLPTTDGRVELVLPAADKVSDERLKRCLVWIEPRLGQLGRLESCEAQGVGFRSILAGTLVFLGATQTLQTDWGSASPSSTRSDKRGWTI